MKRIFVTHKFLEIKTKIFILDDSITDLNELINRICQRFNDFSIDSIYLDNGIQIENLNEINNDDYLNTHLKKNEWIALNIGGTIYQTTKTTLINREPESFFNTMLTTMNWSHQIDSNGLISIKIDRSSRYFDIILDYLRYGKLIVDHNINLEGVLEEANFYSLTNLIDLTEEEILKRKNSNPKLNRQNVINFLCKTKSENLLRFQSVDLSGSDLSKLDLSYINFKQANLSETNLSGCNLSYSSFEKADLSKANLTFAICHGVRMLETNLESSNLSNSDFEDMAGKTSILEVLSYKKLLITYKV